MLQIPWFRSVNLAMDGPTARRWQSLCGGWAEARELSVVSVAQGIRNECALQSREKHPAGRQRRARRANARATMESGIVTCQGPLACVGRTGLFYFFLDLPNQFCSWAATLACAW